MDGEVTEEVEVTQSQEMGSDIRAHLEAQYEVAETEAALAEPVETPAQADARARDERGRFASKSEEPAQPNLEQSAAVVQPVTAPQAPSLETLPHLTSDERAVLAKIDVTAQQIVARKLDETHRKLSDAGRKIASYRELDEALAPRKQQLALNGMTEGTYLKQVITAADMMDANPVESIKHFIRHYGIDPQVFTETQSQESPLDPVRQELAELRGYVQQQEQQRMQAQATSLNSAIQEFRDAKDPSGKPLRPYLDLVANELVPLVHAVRSQNPSFSHQQVLQEAYDRAVYANPETRQKMTQGAQAQTLAQQAQAATAAKLKGSSIVGSPGAGATPVRSGDIRGILEENWQ